MEIRRFKIDVKIGIGQLKERNAERYPSDFYGYEKLMKMKKIKTLFFIALMTGWVASIGPGFAAEEGGERTADDVLALLKEGNARFVDMKMEHPDENSARREETAFYGQKPFAVVIGCSDSRVPVEMIFDRGIGDIFTVRVAGNIAVDSSVIGSLEYAAGHLHVPLLVILSHTQCGVAGAAVSGEKLEGSLADIQEQFKSVVKQVMLEFPDLKDAALTDEVAKRNAFQVERDLRSGSPVIKDLADQGALKIVPALYDIKTGKVEWLEEK
ncbi:MAG: carbonic anhydrase [Candidatus Omnitrophota bacterium]